MTNFWMTHFNENVFFLLHKTFPSGRRETLVLSTEACQPLGLQCAGTEGLFV